MAASALRQSQSPFLSLQVFALGQDGRMQFARALGTQGEAPGQFRHPWGVAVVRGLLVVSETVGQRVQVLTAGQAKLQRSKSS